MKKKKRSEQWLAKSQRAKEAAVESKLKRAFDERRTVAKLPANWAWMKKECKKAYEKVNDRGLGNGWKDRMSVESKTHGWKLGDMAGW